MVEGEASVLWAFASSSFLGCLFSFCTGYGVECVRRGKVDSGEVRGGERDEKWEGCDCIDKRSCAWDGDEVVVIGIKMNACYVSKLYPMLFRSRFP